MVNTQQQSNDKAEGTCIIAMASSLHNLTNTFCMISWKETLSLLEQRGFILDFSTYASLLRGCGNAKALSGGNWVHCHITQIGLEQNLYLANLMLQMYGQCGALVDAHKLFVSMHQRDRFSWNFMIAANARHGKFSEALRLFDQMLGEGKFSDKFISASVLSACASEETLDDGKKVHDYLMNCGLEIDPIITNALVTMYGKCGSIEDAWEMFDKNIERDIISWNAMIAACAQQDQVEESLYLFEQMLHKDVQPNKITFISILSAFSNNTALAEGEHIHALITNIGLDADVAVRNALVSMYGKCGSMEDAGRIFEKMLVHDMLSWNAIITATTQHGHYKEALKLYFKMQQEGGIPNISIFSLVLSACACQAALSEVQQLHVYISCSGFESYAFVLSTLVTMYCKCGSLEEAQRMFKNMQKQDVFLWNDMIAAYAQNGQSMEAFKLFHQMQQEGLMPDKFIFASVLSACTNEAAFPEGRQLHTYVCGSGHEADVVIGTALVNMYGKCGSLEDAKRMFDRMPLRNTLSWSSIVAVCAQHGQGKFALQLFSKMWGEGVLPNKSTFINIFWACGCYATLIEGKRLHACIWSSNLESDVVVGTALLSMYGRCGSLQDSQIVFDEMPERNTLSWNAMIATYAQYGQAKSALRIFDSMQHNAVMPDKATFISILSACSHAGFVDEGFHCFLIMNQDYGIVADVDHFNCIIDLLGRAGQLKEADIFMNSAPFHPAVESWLTLLSACRQMLDVERGENAAGYVFELAPEKSGSYVMLANLYIGEQVANWNWMEVLINQPYVASKGRVHDFFLVD